MKLTCRFCSVTSDYMMGHNCPERLLYFEDLPGIVTAAEKRFWQEFEAKPEPIILLKCQYQGCNFKNRHQEEIDHHVKYTHEL